MRPPATGCSGHHCPTAWNSLLSRRDLLRVGSLGVASTLLSQNLAQGVEASQGAAKARSVIFLWMAGGVTHIDSFDPKPDAPEEIRGTLSAINTNVPGIRFCESMPALARQAHRLAVVRSYSHDSDDHFLSQAYALSGRKVTAAQLTTEPNIGSIVAKLQGGRAGLPGYIAVPGNDASGSAPQEPVHRRLAGRSVRAVWHRRGAAQRRLHGSKWPKLRKRNSTSRCCACRRASTSAV